MKTCKISSRKVKISISPRGGNFQFSARGERYVYLKKTHPGVNFTSPTCNMPLRMPKIRSMVDDQIENSKLSNETKKNNLNLFILTLVLPEIYYRLPLVWFYDSSLNQ